MSMKRWPRNWRTSDKTVRKARIVIVLLVLTLILSGAIAGGMAFRSLVTELAVSSAKDSVTLAVNTIVKEIMNDEAFDPADLVNLEKSADGSIAAVTTNVAAVNTLASRVLERAVSQTAENVITVGIPVGNLLGSALLLGKGPVIPVNVVMLSSSVAGFRSEITSAGINQTRHQILLDLNVEISLLMPWRTIGSEVETEILVSETVIVGKVPDSYMKWES